MEVVPPTLTRRWAALVRDLPLPQITLHDARHTHATLLLQAGVPAQVVSARLGHSDVQTTLSTYAHVMPTSDALAASVVDQLLT